LAVGELPAPAAPGNDTPESLTDAHGDPR
jgi:hypothetical protein